ncbi:hypothetical protein DY000_02039998 [Brassica cretica]|uniref:Aspartic peptidase DDI1-type domain-containing protein n=1 Tax=Brassica cretica TaxID=69181 RepID=A0ABQ7BGW1_BRACR|nr:hypothetical protein DY000_02039998 [Brassica cretica]
MTNKEFAAKHPHPPSPVYVKIDRHSDPVIDRQRETAINRQPPAPIDRRVPLTYRVQMPKIDVARLNALRPQPKPSDNPPEATNIHSDDATDPMEVDRVPMGRTLRKRNEKKKSDPGKFAIPCSVKGIEFPHALRDTGASVSILPRVMADHLGLQVESYKESFTFVDFSQRCSGGIVRDLEVHIGNALVPTDFHVLDIKLKRNSSLLLGRAFLSTVGAVCDMQTN